MRADHQCLRILGEERAFPGSSVGDHWNAQLNPLAPPVFQPSLCSSWLFVIHTTSIARCFSARPQSSVDRAQTSTPGSRLTLYTKLIWDGQIRHKQRVRHQIQKFFRIPSNNGRYDLFDGAVSTRDHRPQYGVKPRHSGGPETIQP